MISKRNLLFLLLAGSLFFTACQNKEKAMLTSFNKLVDVVRFNGLDYQLQYEPHLVKSKKEQQRKTNNGMSDAERFRGHHYLTLNIDGLNPGLATKHQDNYAVLSEYLNDDFRNRFSNPSQVTVQLVFKDQDFSDQENYFQDDISVIYFDKKNREKISWSFSANDLNQFPSLNNNYKNG